MSCFSNKPDEIVTCPYFEGHQVARKRLQRHLIKCRRSYPDVEIIQCPFNVSHLVPEPELNFHLSHCPDKALVVQYKFGATTQTLAEVEISQPIKVECDENWDNLDEPTYRPGKSTGSEPLMRTKIGDLPSRKRKFREEIKDLDKNDSD